MTSPFPATAAARPGTPRRLWRWIGRWTWRLLLTVGVTAALLLLAWHLWVLPRLDQWRPTLERYASQRSGVQVRIERLHADSVDLFQPGFTLLPALQAHNVQVRDAHGQLDARIERVTVAFSLASLWRLGFDALILHRPQVVMHAPDAPTTTTLPWQAARWLLSQPEIRIEQGHWRLHGPAQGQVRNLHDVDVQLRHHLLRGHRIQARLTPQGMGPIDLQAQFDIHHWPDATTTSGHASTPWPVLRGHTTLNLHSADLAQMQPWLHTWLPHPSAEPVLQGQLDARLHIQWDAPAGQQRIRLADLDARLHSPRWGTGGHTALAWDRAHLQLQLQQLADTPQTWRIVHAQFQAQRSAQQWQLGPLAATLDYQPGDAKQAGHIQRLHLESPLLDLGALVALEPPSAAGRATAHSSTSPSGSTALAKAQAQLARWQPSGRVHQLQLDWQPDAASPQGLGQWSLSATFDALSLGMAPQGNAPFGVHQLSGPIQAQTHSGQAQLHITQGGVRLPQLFESAHIALDQLQAQVNWSNDADGQIRVHIDAPHVRNAHAQGSATVQWRTATATEIAQRPASSQPLSRLPGHIDLRARLTRADATHTWRYLPLSIPEPVRRYVRESVRKGRSQQVDFQLRGQLRDFPFDKPGSDGLFRIHAQVDQVDLRYAPHYLLGQDAPRYVWPDLSDVKAQLLFEGARMHIDVQEGRLQAAPQVRITAGQARIDDMRRANVHIQAQSQGPLAPQLQLLASTPASRMTGHSLDAMRGSGQAQLQLQLNIPLNSRDRSASPDSPPYTVAGQVHLPGNDLRWLPQIPPLHNAQGTVHFHEKGFHIQGLKAQALGGALELNARMQEHTAGQPVRVDIDARGTLSAQGLQDFAHQALGDAQGTGIAPALLAGLHGSTDYSVQAHTIDTRAFVTLTSSTQGLGSHLPDPLHKPPASTQPLRFAHNPPDAHGEETVELQWGPNLYARYRLRAAAAKPDTTAAAQAVATAPPTATATSAAASATPAVPAASAGQPGFEVREGVVLIGRFSADERRLSSFIPNHFATPSVEGKVHATIAWDNWNAADWLPWLQRSTSSSPGNATPPPTNAHTSQGELDGLGALRAFIPDIWHGQFQQLQWGTMTLHDVALQTYQSNTRLPAWITHIRAREAQGTLEYHPHYLEGTGLLRGLLERVELPDDFGQGEPSAAAQGADPLANLRQLPTVDLEIERLRLAGRDWGKAALQAINRVQDGLPHEWRINYLTLQTPEAQLTAKGTWRDRHPSERPAHLLAGQKVMDMRFTLQIQDGGALLSRAGLPDVLRAGAGQLDGSLSWQGSPLKLDLPSLEGAFHLDVREGQFLQADAGAARLLGVLSLQALPRRLSLDFRDLFSDGFAFDFVRGDIQIQQGLARTNNLQMQGINAGIVLEGQADLVRETQDIHALIVPELDAMTASLVATAINPAVGAGTLIAQLFLSKPLAQSAARSFHIHGTWDAPIVERTPTERTPATTLQMPEAGDAP